MHSHQCVRRRDIVTAAIRCGVKRVIALSTDQGGQSGQSLWRLQAGLGQDFCRRQQSGRRRRHPLLGGALWQCLRLARFGGALFQQAEGRWRRQPAITDARMTRFWITLTQGVNFVLSSMEMMRGGEIYVPKIPSTTIPDVAGLIAPISSSILSHPSRREAQPKTMIPADDAHCTVNWTIAM